MKNMITLMTFLLAFLVGQNLHAQTADSLTSSNSADTTICITLPKNSEIEMSPIEMSSVLLRYNNGELSSSVAQFEDTLVPIAFFIMVIFLVAIPVFLDYRKKLSLHKVMVSAIEKGADIPLEALNPPKPKRDDLRTGIILVALGFGLTLFLYLSENSVEEAAPGIIPLFIGLGFLVNAALNKKPEATIHDERQL